MAMVTRKFRICDMDGCNNEMEVTPFCTPLPVEKWFSRIYNDKIVCPQCYRKYRTATPFIDDTISIGGLYYVGITSDVQKNLWRRLKEACAIGIAEYDAKDDIMHYDFTPNTYTLIQHGIPKASANSPELAIKLLRSDRYKDCQLVVEFDVWDYVDKLTESPPFNL